MLRVLKISAVLIGISAFTVVVMGISYMRTNNMNRDLQNFLQASSNIDENFEDSLSIYTEYINDVIAYLLKLRPNNETEFVAFISEVEKIGQSLSLNIKIATSEEEQPARKSKNKKDKDDGDSKYLTYKISFYGSMTDTTSFLSKIEAMPYFIEIENINFKNPDSLEDINRENINQNVNITIKLFIKAYGTKRA